ncbi:50S ribosomal protein L33 [Lacticigenium naphthae]|uniref:50S ribosomal protein L33 n=1 Tax=Lacticigenium naphthae TaxID=515351 RepID=UPI000A069C9D|nr:50S ribosomal protein L33 [Lacticigenium naphthae]
MSNKRVALACIVCGSRNYSKDAGIGASTRTERLELKKYCKYCKKHTLHRETK